MDPQQFANAIERYIASLDDEEPPEDILLQLGNEKQHDFYVPTGEDEVDLVDGQPYQNLKNGLAVKRKGQQPAKRPQVGTRAVQQYESRSTPLKPKGRQTLSRNKKPINTNARKPKKQQTSSSSGSDSETTLEKIGNRPNPKYEYVMK